MVASAVTYAVRPLLLFYSLSQAGRAVTRTREPAGLGALWAGNPDLQPRAVFAWGLTRHAPGCEPGGPAPEQRPAPQPPAPPAPLMMGSQPPVCRS